MNGSEEQRITGDVSPCGRVFTPDKLEQRSVKYAEFFEKCLISQEISGRAVDLEEIQEEEDTTPSEITIKIPPEWSLGDLNEPTSYKAAMLDSESNKWIDAMNAEIQSMMDNKCGYLMIDIYMGKPEGLVDPNTSTEKCAASRSIYGLKQASRSWNKRFDKEIKRFGFAQNLDEPCVYQKASGSNVTFLILYVDDIIIMGKSHSKLQSVKDCPWKVVLL
ncbi:retrotransposon protein, putative, ty1-copia subclass [Tanacetum coccineum]